MLNDFYKIGQVIEVRGQKLRIRVFENRNSNVLIYQGQVIKNVSVGSFVKIPKGYSNIVGKIEGEYIQEVTNQNNKHRFTKESETIDRIIEVSILGVLSNNRFKRGLIDIPLVFSDVYILLNDEVQKIFEFAKNKEDAICIGAINDYKEEKLYVDSSTLFASHIGIFGNTGSGKSNTLAKIYTECIDKYKANKGFSKSKFILIDFNGEYANSLTPDKIIYNISTRNDDGDKIPISSAFLEDVEMWSIICEATEKTQKPFLDKVIRIYKNISKSDVKQQYIKPMLEALFSCYFAEPTLFNKQVNYIRELFELLFVNIDKAVKLLETITVRNNGQTFYRAANGAEYWGNSEQDFKRNFTDVLLTLLYFDGNYKDIREYDLFEFSLKYKYLYDLCLKRINEEHISPLISRYKRRSNNIKRIFEIKTEENNINILVYSLVDVNIEFRKIIPLILCKHFYESHKRNKKNKSLHIIIDEAHNILSATSERESQVWKDYRLETFEEIIKEGRKFGVFLTISSQRPSDISETIISQLHNYFIHRLVNNEDIRAIGKAVAFIDNTSYEMISVLPQGACIFTGVASNFPVLVQVDLLDESKQPQSNTIDLVKLWNSNQ